MKRSHVTATEALGEREETASNYLHRVGTPPQKADTNAGSRSQGSRAAGQESHTLKDLPGVPTNGGEKKELVEKWLQAVSFIMQQIHFPSSSSAGEDQQTLQWSP